MSTDRRMEVTGAGSEAGKSWQAIRVVATERGVETELVEKTLIVERLLPNGKFGVSQVEWPTLPREKWAATFASTLTHEIADLRSWGAVKNRLASIFDASEVRDYVVKARRLETEARKKRSTT